MTKIKAAIVPVSNVFEKALSIHKKAEKVKPYVEMSDEELVSAVQSGEQVAFEHILGRYQGKLYAYVMRLTNHRDEAHDIVQDVFLKTYKNIHRFDTSRKFSSWVYRIAHNESVNWLKKKTRAKVESLDSQEERGVQVASSQNIEQEFIVTQDQNAVRDAIAQLPEKYRVVMEMRYLKQRSYQEIADSLDKPVNTVGTLINRAKRKLAKELKLAL